MVCPFVCNACVFVLWLLCVLCVVWGALLYFFFFCVCVFACSSGWCLCFVSLFLVVFVMCVVALCLFCVLCVCVLFILSLMFVCVA